MKIRTDFVTNSSSSSFIIARKKELTDKQKEAIIEYVEEHMLNWGTIESKEEFDEEKEHMYLDESKQEQIYKALEDGMIVNTGTIEFEECDYQLAAIYERLWGTIEKADDKNFRSIDTDLTY